MAAGLSIRSLGGLSIQIDEKPVTNLASRKAEGLLVYLVAEGRSIPREVLADLLWDDRSQRQALANLRVVLSSLRKHAGPYVEITRNAVAVKKQADIRFDARLVEQALDESRHQTDPISSASVEQLDRALAFYEGDFLAGFFLPEASTFESWAATERERLHRLAGEGMRRLGSWYLEHGEYPAAITWATRLVKIDPLAEIGHRLLMEALFLDGRRTQALRQYDNCRQLLQNELGILPEAETDALYEAIRTGQYQRPSAQRETGFDPSPDPGHNAELAQPAKEVKHNLPAEATPFIGREEELATLDELLANSRLISILGPGGMGKTRLALTCAERQLKQTIAGNPLFIDGVFFVPLAALQAVESIIPAIAEAINFSYHNEQASPKEQLLAYLRRQEMLLVLDNFEHLLAGSTIVADILRAAPEVTILVTSRAKLNIQGEQRFRIVGMDYPHWETPEDALKYSSVRLFLQSARRARPGFELDAGNFKYVARICRLTQGMPLGILLVAAWLELLSLEEIVTEMAQSLDFLESELQDVPERHQSIRAVFDYSWNLMNEEERQLLAALSHFRGGFTREAAQAVTGASLRLLMSLVNKSLLQRAPSGRFAIHELLRQYAAEKLAQSPAQQHAVQDQHSAYYCAILQQRTVALQKALEPTRRLVDIIQADLENILLAWEWAVAEGEVTRLDRAADSLGEFYDWHLRSQEASALFTKSARQLAISNQSERTATSLRVETQMLHWQFAFESNLGHQERAAHCIQQWQRLLRSAELVDHDTRREEATLLSVLALTSADENERIKLYKQSLALYEALESDYDIIWVYYSIGSTHLKKFRNYRVSQEWLEKGLAIAQRFNAKWLDFILLGALAELKARQGQLEESERLSRQALTVGQNFGDVRMLRSVHSNFSWHLILQGKFSESIEQSKAGLALIYDVAEKGTRNLIFYKIFADIHLGNYESARRITKELHLFSEQANDLRHLAISLLLEAKLSLAQRQYTDAHALLQKGVSLSLKAINTNVLDTDEDLRLLFPLLGLTQQQLGKKKEAKHTFIEALQRTIKAHDTTFLLYLLPTVALYLAGNGHIAQAVTLQALAARKPLVTNSRWFVDVVGDPLAELAATLPKKVVTVAKERAQKRDMRKMAAELLAQLETE